MSITPRDGDDAVADVEPDPAMAEAAAEVDENASAGVMRLLNEHVPLTLLADLAQPDGPASPAILEDEGLPEVEWWSDPAATETAEATDATDGH